MTTEPTDLDAERRSELRTNTPTSGDSSGGSADADVRRLEKRLREGRLRRLQLDPPAVLTAIVAGSCSAVRFHNAIAAARLGFDGASWRLDAQDRIDLRTSTGESLLNLRRWSYLYHDRESEQLVARDPFGDRTVEFDLDRWCDGLEPDDRSDLAHRAQSPPTSEEPELSEVELHETTFETSTFERAWRDCQSYAETRQLERAARSTREQLLRGLPPQLAHRIHPRRVTEVFSSLCRAAGRVRVDLVGPGHRTTLEPREFESRAGTTVLLGVGGDTHLAVDRRRVESSFIVELPGEEGKRKALELLDGCGELVGRLRRPADADPSKTFAWRAALTGGVRG